MPELPEVETVVQQLNKALKGRVVGKVEVMREKSAQSDLSELAGKRIGGVKRFAKYIVVELENNEQKTINNEQKTENRKLVTKRNNLNLLIHLKMTGQLVWWEAREELKTPNSKLKIKESTMHLDKRQVVGGHPTRDWVGELPSKHTRIVAKFVDGSTLFFNDQRVFGWWKIIGIQDLRFLIQALPPDVIDPGFTVEYLEDVLSRSRRAVKLVILDQAKMGGMGNIYASDALWMAGIDPQRPANKVKKKEVELLHNAMVEVLNKGIELGGASYSHFVDTEGLGGSYQDHFLVYDREGEKCLRKWCRGVIEKIKLGGRGTYFCPKCQV